MGASVCPYCGQQIHLLYEVWTCVPCWRRWPIGPEVQLPVTHRALLFPDTPTEENQ